MANDLMNVGLRFGDLDEHLTGSRAELMNRIRLLGSWFIDIDARDIYCHGNPL